MSNELGTAFKEIEDIRALPEDIILDALQSALVSAYRKDTGASAAQEIEAKIDLKTGRQMVFVEKEVVDDVLNDATEVTLERARFYEPEAQLHDVVMIQVEHTTRSFGRIAAQTAKQVILQKIREAERNALYDEFINREGDLITGTVQSTNARKVTLSLGRAEADLPRQHQIPGERYRTHEKIRVFVVEVSKSNRGPQILVSRAHRSMLRRLLEYEVPEIYNGQVEIKNIAREAGHRSKVAVAALQDGIDPVGACVGMRGIRIQNIVKELHNEKIDVIEWNNDAVAFISKALSPARVTGVYLDDDPVDGRTAVVLVPDDQLSLAIGREGQNARLAAKLTGWRIDIKSVAETVQSALDNLETAPLDTLTERHADLIAESLRIMEKKRLELAVMPEEYKSLGRLAGIVEQQLQEQRDEAHQTYLQKRKAALEELAPQLFELPLDVLAVSQEALDILEPFENIGEVMLLCAIDETLISRRFADLEGEPMTELRAALDFINAADLDQLLAEAISIEEVEEEEAAEDEALATPAEDSAVAEPAEDAAAEGDASQPEVMLDAFGQPIREDAKETEAASGAAPVEGEEIPAPVAIPAVEIERERDQRADQVHLAEEEGEREFELERQKGKQQRRQDRQRRRQLVLDEDSGEVIAKRRRKGSRGSWDEETWEDYDY
ncbi:MAG: transcription termination factor NusA [Chloroflexota bacterium]|nr:transcription termination factor NusA [Chloroflexota bacterium]MDE2909156.1 transcription termination factor NusA [Chloroflexota bacterium]